MFKGTPGIKVSVESLSLSLYILILILLSEREKILKILSLESKSSIENCVHQSLYVVVSVL
jgi:hypothetical protein